TTRYTAAYLSLAQRYGFTAYGAGHDWLSPRFYRTFPGTFGARAAPLYAHLKKGHKGVTLSADDWQRIIIWLDSVCQFYGVYEKEGGETQLAGGIAHPTLE
ncbi:MAG TPA: hypothetical protein PLT74_10890, partial [Kiritimatiellia bacterium]|nr:hypothetical protein [Kiritimatiellia bacterium]